MQLYSGIVTSLFLFCVSFTNIFAAGLNLSVESEFGVQNGVPDAKNDTQLGTYPLYALLLEPSWVKAVGKNETFSATASLNALKYIGGSGELSLGPQLLLEKTLSSSVIEITGAATYNNMPTAYEQTIPDSYFEFLLKYDQHATGALPFGGVYALSLLRDIETPRIDVKNTLQFTAKKNVTSKWYLFFKLGCAWNLSTLKGDGYVQPHTTAGASYIINSRNMLFAQLFGNYTFYETTWIPSDTPPGNRGNGKGNGNDSPMNDLDLSGTPFVTLYTDYDRELSTNWHLHFIYMFTLFGREDPHSVYNSHYLSILIEWNSE